MRRRRRVWLSALVGAIVALEGGPARSLGYDPKDRFDGTGARPGGDEVAAEAAAPVEVEPEEAARALALESFRRGRDLYNASEWAAAAAAFRRSYEALPSLEALFAEARALDAGGEALGALRVYEEYLDFEDDDAARHEEGVRRQRELRGQVGELTLRVGDPAAVRTVRVDGEVVGLESFPRRMLPGRVMIEIVGAEPLQRRTLGAEVRAGESSIIEFEGFPKVAVVRAPPIGGGGDGGDERDAEARGRRLQGAFWGGVALSAVSGVAVATLGGLTLDARSDYASKLCPPPASGGCPDNAKYPAAEEARFGRLKTATNAMVAVTGVVAAVTLGLGIAALRARRGGAAGRRGAWRRGAVGVAF